MKLDLEPLTCCHQHGDVHCKYFFHYGDYCAIMKPKSLYHTKKGKAIILILLLGSLFGISYLTINFNKDTTTVSSGSFNYSCEVLSGPNNTPSNPTYQLNCTIEQVIMYEDNLDKNTGFNYYFNYNSSNSQYSPDVGFYVIDDDDFESNPAHVFAHEDVKLDDTKYRRSSHLKFRDNYRFLICICTSEIDPVDDNPTNLREYDYGFNFTESIRYELDIIEAPFYNQYNQFIIGYFVLLLLGPIIIQQIRLYQWEQQQVAEEESKSLGEQVRRHYDKDSKQF